MQKLFNVSTLDEDDPEWLEIKQFLMTGLVPEGLNTSERKAFILRTLKFTMIENVLYRLGRDGIIRRCVPRHARPHRSLKKLMEGIQVDILLQNYSQENFAGRTMVGTNNT